MENEIFFCKSSVSKSFVRTPKNPLGSSLIMENSDGKFFCLEHRKWEDGRITRLNTKTNEIAAKLECGNIIEGFYTNSNQISYRVKVNNNDSCPLLIEENCVDYQKFKNFCEGKLFLKTIPVRTEQKCYGGKNLKRILREEMRQCDFDSILHEDDYIVKNYAEKLLWRAQKHKNNLLSPRPSIPNIKEITQDMRLEILASYPCEPGVALLAGILPVEKIRRDDKNAYYTLCEMEGIKSWPLLRKKFNKNPFSLVAYINIAYSGFKDKNVINDILSNKYCDCFFSGTHLAKIDYSSRKLKFFLDKILKLKSERAVWNMLLKNLKSYVPPQARLRQEEEEKSEENENHLHCIDFDTEDGSSAITQRDIDLLLGAISEDYVPSSNCANYISDLMDAAKMFKNYYEHLPPEVIQSVMNEGLSKYNHDLLSKFNPDLMNFKFNYTKEQLALEDNVLGYEFYLPKESFELVNLGSQMHNCVGSYVESVEKKLCTIVAAMENGFPVLCIEVRDFRKVQQARADHNATPEGRLKEVFDTWRHRHHLIFTENKW